MSAETTPRLELRGISKRYPGVLALSDVSMRIMPGEVVGLLGENGAGKSTLVKILSGVTRPTTGEVLLDGEPLSVSDPSDALHSGIATVFQESMLVPNLTVAENLTLGREPSHLGWFGPIRSRAQRAMALEAIAVSGFDLAPDDLVSDLTRAGKQLVELARAISLDSRLVILDEPTSALTPQETDVLFGAVRRLAADGIAVIYITHRLEEVPLICDRVMVLRDGALVGEVAGNAPQERMVMLMVGRAVEALFPPKVGAAGGGEPVLRVTDLRIGRIGPVSLELRRGEVLGFVGLLGSAQQVVGRAIFGALRADAGSVHLDGHLLSVRRPPEAAEAGIAFLGADRQTEGVIPTMSLRGNLTLRSLPEITRHLFLSRSLEEALAGRLRHQFGIRSYGTSQPMDTLSGGNQQKTLLARWLAKGPKAIILEDPTAGIDIGAKEEVYRIVRQLAADGRGVIVISSDSHELAGICDRVIGFDQFGTVGELSGEAVTPANLISLTVRRTAHEIVEGRREA